MRFGSLSLLVVLGVAGLGCGGGSGGLPDPTGQPGNGDAAYQTPPSTYELPSGFNPTTYEPPPGTYDTPPSSYQTPPGQNNAGGVGSGAPLVDVCSRACGEVLALHCPNSANPAPTQAQCAQGCAEPNGVTCLSDYAAALECVLDNVTPSCDLAGGTPDQKSVDAVTATCQAPLVALADCEQAAQRPNPTPAPGRCTPSSCGTCPTQCDRCICENNDAAMCTMICANT
ncbi:MAG TPA: hypothetical protein VMI54_08955 [Polyangiaceae bacterium]|nr:hypothetical protein [Polyangiaceae bacterium]